ncbi:uncharacterized protein LOC108033414 [Drosophila biarmipes]|uniref:uncharacterized protein LOC108033414 n=1 Tax=Drosophila biarmipes TaxID=125945 RepID=UPI0007E5D70F|nr:uncharacterized protein LOC108033414 [Drosophila biarmipes]
MRVLFPCSAVLLLLMIVAKAQQRDIPKSDLTPQNVSPKSKSLQKDSSTSDSSVLLKDANNNILTSSVFPKNDKKISISPKSDPWKNIREADLPLEDDPKSEALPLSTLSSQNVIPKSESLQRDSSKMGSDSSVLLKEPSLKVLTHNNSISAKNDSTIRISPKSGQLKNIRVIDLPLEDDPKSEAPPLSISSISSQNVIPKSESLQRDSLKMGSDSTVLLKEPSLKVLTHNNSISAKDDSTIRISPKSGRWKNIRVIDLPLEDDPKSAALPLSISPVMSQIVQAKSETLKEDYSKNDTIRNDSSMLLKESSMKDLTQNNSISPKNDSTIGISPKSGRWKDIRVIDLPLEDDPKTGALPPSNSSVNLLSDSFLNGASPSGSTKKDPPLNQKPKTDFLMIVPYNRVIGKVPHIGAPNSRPLILTTSEAINELRKRLMVEVARTELFRNRSTNLLKEILASNSMILKSQKESPSMVAEMNKVDRQLLEVNLQLESVQKQLKMCQGRLSGNFVLQIAENEANRLFMEERKPLIRYSHRNRYLKLLRHLRRRVKDEIYKISELVEDTTTTEKPTPGIFPTLPWF